MINRTTRPPLGGRVQLENSPNLLGCVKLKALIFFAALWTAAGLVPAAGQQSASLCLAVTTLVNGQTTTSCVPVSSAYPLPVSVLGTSTATLTANTTPTSGFTAGQLLMGNGTTIVPAGAAVATSLGLTGALTAASETLTGIMAAASYTVGGTAGVSCVAASVSLTTFVVTNGIVTHC